MKTILGRFGFCGNATNIPRSFFVDKKLCDETVCLMTKNLRMPDKPS
eukprot:UN33618